MKRSIPLLVLGLASCAPTPIADQEGPARELIGRTAGAPQHCVTFTSLGTLRVSDGNSHVLVYGDGRTIWANQIGQCRFGSNDILITEPRGSQYCRGDIVRSMDRTSRIPGPTCILSDFVPYSLPVR